MRKPKLKPAEPTKEQRRHADYVTEFSADAWDKIGKRWKRQRQLETIAAMQLDGSPLLTLNQIKALYRYRDSADPLFSEVPDSLARLDEVRSQGMGGVLLASFHHGELAKRCDAAVGHLATMLRQIIAEDVPLIHHACRAYGYRTEIKAGIVYPRPTDSALRRAKLDMRKAAEIVEAVIVQ